MVTDATRVRFENKMADADFAPVVKTCGQSRKARGENLMAMDRLLAKHEPQRPAQPPLDDSRVKTFDLNRDRPWARSAALSDVQLIDQRLKRRRQQEPPE
jgi:hypothetical protein